MNIARKLVTPSFAALFAVAGAFDTIAADFAGIFPDFVRNCYIVSPGLIYPRASMTQVVDALEAAGYGVKVGPCVYREGNDDQYVASGAEKAQEFLDAWTDANTDIIIAARGGGKTEDLINNLDFDALKGHDKIFTGFSDETKLVNALYWQGIGRPLLGPNAGTMLTLTDSAIDWNKKMMAKEDLPSVQLAIEKAGGAVTGKPCGGTASSYWHYYKVFRDTELWAKIQPQTAGRILFLEGGKDEEAGTVLGYIDDLIAWNAFDGVAAIVFCKFSYMKTSQLRLVIEGALSRFAAAGIDVPVYSGFPHGHDSGNRSIDFDRSLTIGPSGLAVFASYAAAPDEIDNSLTETDLTAAVRDAGFLYTATASACASGKSAAMAFDGVKTHADAQWWQSPTDGGVNQWLHYQFNDEFQSGKGIYLTSYSIYDQQTDTGSGTSKKMPKGWTLEGSNDGVTWTLLDARNDYTSWKHQTWSTFDITTVHGCFRHYRFNFIAVQATKEDCQYYRMHEIAFNGYVLASPSSRINTYAGEADGDWDEGANWTFGVPVADDYVVIPGGKSVTLRGESAALASIDVQGTLTFDGWNVVLNAADCRVSDGGVVTTVAGGETEDSLSRVQIVCGNLTVGAGGKIDVTKKGYAPGTDNLKNRPGNGLGSASMRYNGAAHGGFGGTTYDSVYSYCPLPVGSAEHPELCGASGWGYSSVAGSSSGQGGAGGGAVKIVATGKVVVNGTIEANGGNTCKYGTSFAGTSFRDTAGAGGSVWIACDTIAGEYGAITANGGGGCVCGANPNENCTCAAGGGGRIALHFSTAHQPAGAFKAMTISADAGEYRGGGSYAQRDYNCMDDDHLNADIGSVWMSDGSILADDFAKLAGQIRNVREVTFSTFALTNGHVRFAEDGVRVTVLGDLAVSNKTAWLEIGGDEAVHCTTRATLSGAKPAHLVVGGNLVLGADGRLDVNASKTNGLAKVDVEEVVLEDDPGFGAFVTVAGDITIAEGARIHPISHASNGGAPFFSAANLRISEGGAFSADGRGFACGAATNSVAFCPSSYGLGPGGGRKDSGNKYAPGGGHGGAGGASATTKLGGFAYDDDERPALAGSGGGVRIKENDHAGFGGGVVRVDVTGEIVVDGTVSADGDGSDYGGGAGGTILLNAPVFSGSSTGCLSARGGDANGVTLKSGSLSTAATAGGGGRIAVWTGVPWSETLRKGRKGRSGTPHVFDSGVTFLGTYTVAGGVIPTVEGSGIPDDINAESGSVWFFNVTPPGGLLLLIR